MVKISKECSFKEHNLCTSVVCECDCHDETTEVYSCFGCSILIDFEGFCCYECYEKHKDIDNFFEGDVNIEEDWIN